MIIPGDSDARGSQATLRKASASGLGWSWGELSWALKGEILVNSDQAGRILGRGQPGWAPVRGTGSADAQVHVGDGAGKEASDGFDGGLNIHTG